MLDIRFIREYPEKVKQSLADRNVRFDVDYLIDLDERRRGKIAEVEEMRNRQNVISDEIAGATGSDREQKISESRSNKEALAHAEFEMKTLEEEFHDLMYRIPNVLHPDVPMGKDDLENKVLRKWGEIRMFGFEPKDHVALGETLGIIDTEKATQVSGARFTYLKGPLVLLQFALVQFAFDVLGSREKLRAIGEALAQNYSDAPFMPVAVPLMIRPEVYAKAARLSETTKEDRYRLADDDLYLIGSGEHTLVPLHMNEVVEEDRLPLRYVAFSSCFRREAGSYGKDTRGILRMHQFEKVEMESFTTGKEAFSEHLFFIAIQEYLVQALGLPYQVVLSCSGDTDDPCTHHVDIECWMPGQNKYRETHSADYTTDYQTRRLNSKAKKEDGSHEFLHTNDATVFAIGRTLIAILENYQQEDGSVEIPKVLQPYMGGLERIV
jgi:seryl-tRNA synthetase